ncbi:hypothetical protein ACP70R_018198 [Stipagrostis hirtigluma subsp. patula]
MALRHHLPLVAVSLLLLAVAAAAAAAAMGQQQQQGERRVGMTMRYADEEESRWLDRWAETHEPLGSGRPMRVQPATEEEARWLNRMSANDKKAQESHRRGSGDGYLEFEADNPYLCPRLGGLGLALDQAARWSGESDGQESPPGSLGGGGEQVWGLPAPMTDEQAVSVPYAVPSRQ